jgi:hypothetical protein
MKEFGAKRMLLAAFHASAAQISFVLVMLKVGSAPTGTLTG